MMKTAVWRDRTIAWITSSVLIGSGLVSPSGLAAEPPQSPQAETETEVVKPSSGVKNGSQDPYVNGGPSQSDASGTR